MSESAGSGRANALERQAHRTKETSCLREARATTAEILERMTETEWQREGTHSEAGRYTVDRWLEIYAAHAHNHVAQICVARNSAHK